MPAVERMDSPNFMRHRTCGYLVKRTQTYVGVALSVGWMGTVGDTIQIPRPAIIHMQTLRKGDYAVPDDG